jgi:erythromycin esterase-like protein
MSLSRPRHLIGTWLLAGLLALSQVAGATSMRATSPVNPGDIAASAEAIVKAAGGHRLLLLGEMHGTREPPALLLALATRYAQREPVLVGLEIQDSEQPAIRRYLASGGGAAEQALLRSGTYWQVPRARSDGRRNVEILDMIDGLRRLRAAGRDVAVLAIDAGVPGGTDSQARDRAMARRVRVAFKHLPRGRMLVLTGNVHAMRERPDYAPPEMQDPMGHYLLGLSPFAINVTARSGQFWACMEGSCGPRDMHDVHIDTGPRDGHPYDFEVVLDRYSIAHLVGVATR